MNRRKSKTISELNLEDDFLFAKVMSDEEVCRQESDLLLGDGTTKVFLNTKGKSTDIDDDLKAFLAYLEDTTDSFVMGTNSELVKEIHKKVVEVKKSKEMEAEYMTLLQRDREKREEGREEGIEVGRAEEKMNIARSLLDVLDEQTIAAKTGLTIEEVKNLKK